jgi:DNA-directed RNA polymerase specialized sigma24 family protein
MTHVSLADTLNNGFFNAEELKKGNPMAFAVAYRQLQPAMQSMAYARCGAPDDASKIASEAITDQMFVQLWDRRDAMTTSVDVCSYLYFAVEDKSLHFSESDRDPLKEHYVCHTDLSEITGELDAMAEQALDPELKKLFVLSYKEFKSNTQIAAKLSLSLDEITAQQEKIVTAMNHAWANQPVTV